MPATTGSAILTLPSDTEILMVREFDAPRELVFKAYTTPELVKRWWAGKRGNVTIADIDLRVGGRWRYVMVADAGFEVAFHGEYQEIVPNEKLVNTEIFEGAPEAGAAVVTCTFEDLDGGRTKLSMLTSVDTKEIRDMIIGTGMESGAQEGLDILEQIAIELAA
ncbi:SRPBCC family protein [Solirubrobacter ginsenosidimutans]|uniref:SRPBCC family protein n=1 Tax=Solirubrobacter ginsenosidimutans TaxID=490573 RepID=A0A9X3S3T7_9ACTN|nr:SRPBCC family protein [Solirubrobacter ginsenosidimutans]MDA0166080.1 SRPBCC family protein [Solirubrobacter ginsenosidimutans]